ncbi:VOC family protein [Agromyces sp. M3QZ16-3]|uniref:VOC family protein n=1 Tax=Agromyces sp. M3QZ16-3 TaxID=3447585 RepID=UPI003F693767
MIESAFPIVEVPDMEAALRFYRDGLGATVTYRFPPEGEPVFATLQAGSSQVGLGLAEGATAGEGAGMLLWFYVDDVDAVTTSLAEAGFLVVEEPSDSEWGERVSLVSDPFGTRVRLGQPIAPPPDEE